MSHPEEDCEDCGKFHIPWSRHDREQRRREAEADEHGDAAEMRFTRLYGLSPEGVPLYVEVPEEGYLPEHGHGR
ncbi:MAG TPA: hypothetical protein VM142_01645 [Acidimicrobiales bacterium]|nr:hypothetical protein [Acidimicrobiales bacterium]